MSIYDKKYQIFVSSTYNDLIKAREEVIKVILSLYQIPIGMEMFSADNDEQWSIIRSTIDNSDYYLLIIGHRYGSLTKENISYTEKEFDYAKSMGIPIIAFVRNREIATTPAERDESQAKIELLKDFLTKVLNNAMCDFWNSENELGQKVAIALTKIFFKTPRVGWLKADKANSLETTEEITKLIKENRDLRDELNEMKSSENDKIPSIELKINDKQEINLKLNTNNIFRYNKIDVKDVPGKLITEILEKEIELYNIAIEEAAEEIEKYKTECSIYDNIKNNSLELDISVLNTGKSKASDVYIDINFPKEVIIYEKGDFKSLPRPLPPHVPENPVEKALAGKRFAHLACPQVQTGLGIDFNFDKYNINKTFWIDKDKNRLTIKIAKLTHTRKVSINEGIMIAPLARGIFEYETSIICDEMKSQQKNFYKLSVE